jgi:multidrug efflux pump subunit AcrB
MTFASPLQIEIAGYDLDGLALVNQAIVAEMSAEDRFADIRTTIERGNPEIQIVFDQERAAKLGLSVRDIADRVVANVRGELATRYTWRDRKIDVLVRSVDTRRSSIDEVRQLIVNPMSDRPVTLEAVADVSISQGPAEIRRVAQERVAIITANVAYGDLGAAALAAEAIIDRLPMPAGISATCNCFRSERRNAGFVPLHAIRARTRDLPCLPRDGVAIRITDPPICNPLYDSAGAGGCRARTFYHGHDDQYCGLHRRHHAGWHRCQ